jgi:hypothetical protein
MDVAAYLEAIKLKLASSPIVRSVVIVQERSLPDQGFFRARLTLQNDDFVEVTEYFVVERDIARTGEYRYQWMDATQQMLRKRWDNAEHHRSTPSFPHHVHVAKEDRVEPGRSLSIIESIDIIESEVAAQ